MSAAPCSLRDELLGSSAAEWQNIRGSQVAMVFQDPMTALNPMYTVGWQVAECIRLHREVSQALPRWSARSSCCDAVGLPSRPGGASAIRTSCLAACASGW